ncbi:hypothetical protein ACFE33_11105 [Falsihalocynthiibacter sp. SS001]|uniref:hypothetical protein n=1 Tax=Falsihalocynthiibacter sp. SS001 TaxID=3349698 RepID=UPI0036D275AB
MRKPTSMRRLEALGRVRLSKYFYMRDFLFSEIAAVHGFSNIPDDPDIAIKAGRALCSELLDPLQETFGAVALRSGYRSAEVNQFGNAHGLNCARNEADFGGHIWDHLDSRGALGACVCVVIPWFADRYEQGRDWHDLAWWLHDYLPYSEIRFFPKLAAFNLTYSEQPKREIRGWIGGNSVLLREGEEPQETLVQRKSRYQDFPKFCCLDLPH